MDQLIIKKIQINIFSFSLSPFFPTPQRRRRRRPQRCQRCCRRRRRCQRCRRCARRCLQFVDRCTCFAEHTPHPVFPTHLLSLPSLSSSSSSSPFLTARCSLPVARCSSFVARCLLLFSADHPTAHRHQQCLLCRPLVSAWPYHSLIRCSENTHPPPSLSTMAALATMATMACKFPP